MRGIVKPHEPAGEKMLCSGAKLISSNTLSEVLRLQKDNKEEITAKLESEDRSADARSLPVKLTLGDRNIHLLCISCN